MEGKLTETVTVTREVPSHLSDLVRFAKRSGSQLSDDELVKEARAFWEEQHGED